MGRIERVALFVASPDLAAILFNNVCARGTERHGTTGKRDVHDSNLNLLQLQAAAAKRIGWFFSV